MSDKNFDQQLNRVLDNLEVPYEPATWALMEQRLDSVFGAESPSPVDPVDQAVFHSLDRLEAPYQPAHWDMLERQMKRQSGQIRRLRLAKFAEAAIFLLLLANVGLFLEQKPGHRPTMPKFHSDVPVAEAGPGRPAPRHSNTNQGVDSNGSAYGNLLPAVIASAVTSTGAPEILSTGYLTDPSTAETLAKLSSVANEASNRIFASIVPADLLQNDALSGLNIPDRHLLLPTASIQPFPKSGHVYAATYASINQNQVLINGNRQSSLGYGGGMAVGYRPGKWGVEAGVGYAHNNYVPKKQIEIYNWNANGYYGSTITEVNNEMITVPVKVTRQIARMGKTTAQAVAGVTANIAAGKAYDYGTVFYSDPLPNAQPSQNQAPKLRQNGQGVLEGGPLNGNFYASLDAGLRIERPIAGGRYTAFVEPSFRQNLGNKGVGPKREPLNSFGFQAGVMAFL